MFTLEIEANQACNLGFKRLERVTLALNLGEGGADIEVQKCQASTVEQDDNNNQLLWHVANIHEEGSAVLQFASSRLHFDSLFPLEARFDETYSLIDVKVEQVVNANTGDAMSLKEIHSLSSESYFITD